MNKTYFISYWSLEYNQIFNMRVQIYVLDMSKGEIAERICSKLNSNSRLINFWEI